MRQRGRQTGHHVRQILSTQPTTLPEQINKTSFIIFRLEIKMIVIRHQQSISPIFYEQLLSQYSYAKKLQTLTETT